MDVNLEQVSTAATDEDALARFEVHIASALANRNGNQTEALGLLMRWAEANSEVGNCLNTVIHVAIQAHVAKTMDKLTRETPTQ